MLKNLAFVVFLAVVLPISGQQKSPKAGEDQIGGENAGKQTPPSLRVVTCELKQDGGAMECRWSEALPENYLKRLFSPENAPNIALVAIGFCGVLAAVLTLKKIKIQADEMRLQRLAMETTLQAINRQADLMERQANEARESSAQSFEFLKKQTDNLQISAKAAAVSALTAEESTKAAKDRERARLVIRIVDRPEISGPEPILQGMCALRIRVFVENLGRSKAFRVRAYGVSNVVSSAEGRPHERGFLQEFPQIIDEGEEKYPLKLGGFGLEFEDDFSVGDFLAIPQATVQMLRNGEAFVETSGMLSYEDIFGDTHTTPFRFVWKSAGDDDGGKWLTRSFWRDCSPRSIEQQRHDDPN